ncbi:putative bifunctional diguanylate cyclase/phosphodiesterase [Embleya sp. NPDC059237]|uniref:putative bifunctional diguanylate cyclase/phosphodiesterase n=1 Tax=Embleya sp. NPDC059237 TaxID=3346784 RepID=UPI0036B99705
MDRHDELVLPSRGTPTWLKPLKDDLPDEVRDWAEAVRTVFQAFGGLSVRRYSARRHMDPATLSRFLNGTRIPQWEFVTTLLDDVAEHRGQSYSPDVFEHLRRMHRSALQATGSPFHQLQMLEEQLREADELARQAGAREEELNELLAARQRRITDLENQMKRLRIGADTERARMLADQEHRTRLDGERQRLLAEISQLQEELSGAKSRSAHAEARCAALERRIAEIEEVEQDLDRLHTRLRLEATHDQLTGLPNRALLVERLTQAHQAPTPSTRVGLCKIDLDGITAVNDSLGHDVGDQLLIAAARRLSRYAAQAGHLFVRMGGDEFAVLVEDTTGTDQVIAVAEGVLAALREPFRIRGHDLTVTASIGVVERSITDAFPEEILRTADITLDWAKSDGRGRWTVFDADRNERKVARHTLSAEMPAALHHGEFYVDYQPLFSLADGAVLGAEALVRWRHPRNGLVGPDHFIGLAEETGLIVPLGMHVLKEACREARRWQDLDPKSAPFISVNLSERQCSEGNLIHQVEMVLAETALPAGRLQFELTESQIMSMDGGPLERLRELAAMGIRIAIDNFGTGYSNLTYLRALPVCELKIAGSFVEVLRQPDPPNRGDGQLVVSLIELAHAIGLTVTAEGIETSVQADRLRSIGCDAGQGWYFSQPGPPERIATMMGSLT